MQHSTFHYDTLDAVREEANRIGEWLPLADSIAPLMAPLTLSSGHTLASRLVLQPMEGSDGTADGAPGPLTCRRYERFARGGAALIWFEAVAIAPEVRASPHQLYLTEENLPAYARLVESIKETGLRHNGYAPLLIMQATHSGRYARPEGVPAPIIAYNNPLFEGANPIDASRIVTDDALKRYAAQFEQTARLAQRAGFDGIDIKSCHRYLASELLSAYERPGPYGGSFANRTRYLYECFDAATAGAQGDFILTCRLNAYDGYPYPYGFGVDATGGLTPVLDEAIGIARHLQARYHIPLLNITIGNPYTNPHVNRPYDHGNYVPPEHPLTGLSRMMRCVSAVQRAVPSLPVIGSAMSYLRVYAANLAAGMVQGGHAALAGFGRMAFANPDFPSQLRQQGQIDAKKVCIACGQCAKLLRGGGPSGCVVRDAAYPAQRKEEVQ